LAGVDAVGSPSPRFRGEGWGEGLFRPRTVRTPAIGGWPPAPHPEAARRRAVSDLSPQAGRGDWGCGQFFHTFKGRITSLGFAWMLLLASAGAMAQQSAARQACSADIKQLCAEVKPGDGRLKACVKEHFGQLSAACQTALISNVTITKSCKTDAQQKCPGIEPGGGRIQVCMKDHFQELTESCKESLLLAKLQQQ
jgi:Cysteine rich repeat